MSVSLVHFFRKIDETLKIIFSYWKPSAILIFLCIGCNSVKAQEYATDRIFMKEYDKAKCRVTVEKMIKLLKKSRDMTLEHQEFLNRNILSKSRINLPLSHGEKKRLNDLKQNRMPKKKISYKGLLAKNAEMFRSLRSKCK